MAKLGDRLLRRRCKRDKHEEKWGGLRWLDWEKCNDSCISENYSKDADLDGLDMELSETVETPSGMAVSLLPYQKEWLAWALKQEAGEVKGGILADEMGMGKTIEAIALVLATREMREKSRDDSAGVKTTLVVCPVIGLKQWADEIDGCTAKGSTNFFVYLGSRRKKYKKYKDKLADYDFVLTSYSTVDDEYRKMSNRPRRNHPLLYSVKWDRIILDEAHYIEDASCDSTPLLALESSYKWALTGMPLHKRDFHDMIRFLQVVPYAYFFCNYCDCRALKYSFSADCPHCPHKNADHFSWWDRYIASPSRTIQHNEAGRDAIVLLRHKVLKNLLLKRSKKEKGAEFGLPAGTVTVRWNSLADNEYEYYMSVLDKIKPSIESYNTGFLDLDNNYTRMHKMLTDMHVALSPLRQAVDHRYLVEYSSSDLASGNTDADDVEQSCSCCHGVVEDPVIFSMFRKPCLIDFAASTAQESFPSCPKSLTCDVAANSDQGDIGAKPTIKGFWSSSILNKIQLRNFQTSTKIDALREEIEAMLQRDGSAKGIVFSQFTPFLDLIHYSLKKYGISCVQLGSMCVAARDAAVTRFNEDPNCRIFLMSLKVGTVVNLTVASQVFLMEPLLDGDIEKQVEDYLHRIGQYKPVRIVKFVIENTIEQWTLDAQTKKQHFDRLLTDSFDRWEKLSKEEALAMMRGRGHML